jgi:hypothetical protein
MASSVRWHDPEGEIYLNDLVQKLVPQWTDGLRQQQDEVIAYILDGEDTIYSTAPGGGKSAAIALPILIPQELAQKSLSDLLDFDLRRVPVGRTKVRPCVLEGNAGRRE